MSFDELCYFPAVTCRLLLQCKDETDENENIKGNRADKMGAD